MEKQNREVSPQDMVLGRNEKADVLWSLVEKHEFTNPQFAFERAMRIKEKDGAHVLLGLLEKDTLKNAGLVYKIAESATTDVEKLMQIVIKNYGKDPDAADAFLGKLTKNPEMRDGLMDFSIEAISGFNLWILPVEKEGRKDVQVAFRVARKLLEEYTPSKEQALDMRYVALANTLASGSNIHDGMAGLKWIEENTSDEWKSRCMDDLVIRHCRNEELRRKATEIFANAETRYAESVTSFLTGSDIKLLKRVIDPLNHSLVDEANSFDDWILNSKGDWDARVKKGDALLKVAAEIKRHSEWISSLYLADMTLPPEFNLPGLIFDMEDKERMLSEEKTPAEMMKQIYSMHVDASKMVLEKARALYNEAIDIAEKTPRELTESMEAAESCRKKLRELDKLKVPENIGEHGTGNSESL